MLGKKRVGKWQIISGVKTNPFLLKTHLPRQINPVQIQLRSLVHHMNLSIPLGREDCGLGACVFYMSFLQKSRVRCLLK